VTTRLRPRAPDGEPPPGEAEEFEAAKGFSVSTNNPFLRAALHRLFEAWPRSVPFEAVWDAVLSRLGGAPPPEAGPDLLAAPLLQCFLAGLVELHLRPPRFMLEVSERPVASPLARLQARADGRVTNLRHYSTEASAFDRLVLVHLDGSRDRAALLEVLARLVADGFVELRPEGGPAPEEGGSGEDLTQALDRSLRRLAQSALLLG
jgi:hypothetical protein